MNRELKQCSFALIKLGNRNFLSHTLIMLCQNCQTAISIADAEWTSERYTIRASSHTSLITFQRSVAAGCIICRQVYADILSDKPNVKRGNCFSELELDANSVVELWLIITTFIGNSKLLSVGGRLGDDMMGTRFRLDPLSENSKSSTESHPEMRSVSTSGTVDLWRDWFRTCSETHSKCKVLQSRLTPFTPTRLVEVLCDGEGQPQKWRLILGADVQTTPYFTLSHCWGSSQHISLMKHNIHDLMAPMFLSTLPATYRDALTVVASLGMRYIWIDSLCIIQDDEHDWISESSMMRMIYKTSACNIAALWANNSSAGCFALRDPYQTDPTIIKLQSGTYSAINPDLYHNEIKDTPLSKRAWVIQERYLTRRQLSFAQSQVYWECPKYVASEQFINSMPAQPATITVGTAAILPPVNSTLKSNMDLRKTWSDLIQMYSYCQLTHLSDKMIALAGIAGEFRAANNDIYLAGLWKQNLEDQLCWSFDPNEFAQQNHAVTPTYLAPTWSWVNFDGPVQYDPMYCSESPGVRFMEILEATVKSEDPNGLHSFTSSKLIVRGIGLWGCLEAGSSMGVDTYLRREPGLFTLAQPLKRIGKSSLDRVNASIDWDEYHFSPIKNPDRCQQLRRERSQQLLFLLFGAFGSMFAHGLVLRILDTTGGEVVCVRVGVVVVNESEFCDILREKIGCSGRSLPVGCINLDNPNTASLVQKVTIV